MTWFRIAFDEAISHAVSSELFTPLVVDMLARGHAIADFEKKYGREHAKALGDNPAAITEWAFDIGGPCHRDVPVEAFPLHGLTIAVPCDQFDVIERKVDGATVRRFASGEWYYKLKFWVHAAVLTVAQYDELAFAMGERAAAAKETARRFREQVELAASRAGGSR